MTQKCKTNLFDLEHPKQAMESENPPTCDLAVAELTISTPPDMPRSSAQRVFGIPELLEGILKEIPPLELFKLEEVSKAFISTIRGSSALQKSRLDAVLESVSSSKANHLERWNVQRRENRGKSRRLEKEHCMPTSPFKDSLHLKLLEIYPFKLDTIVEHSEEQRNGSKRVPEVQFTFWPKAKRHIIGYKGKERIHHSSQSWSCLKMREPFALMVWVFPAVGEDFYKQVARFGPGKRSLRDLFDVLHEIMGRSMEEHMQEARKATWNGRC